MAERKQGTGRRVGRRGFLTTGALTGAAGLAGLGGILALPRPAGAAPTPAEQANIKIVNDFCAAWAEHNLDKLLAFFPDNGAYRMTETMEPAKGREALTARMKSIVNNVVKFDILDTWARGPMVINERIDSFSNFQLKSWHGVGVFFVKDGKIVEWYDYTIDSQRS